MKKVLILVVALLAVPAMAAPVTITCSNVDTVVTVSYTADSNLIRGFGVDITLDNGATITDVTVIDSDYRIYPGQIYVVDGNVIDYNTPYAQADMDDADGTITVELASLYTDDANYIGDPNYGYGMQPTAGGPFPLFTFTVSGDCNYTVSGNAARGGIVMENPDEDPNAGDPYCGGSAGPPAECVKSTAPFYNRWVGGAALALEIPPMPPAPWSKPDCWCYPRHGRGDADGAPLAPFVGVWVTLNDLNILRGSLNKMYNLPGFPVGGECADFDHSMLAPGVPMSVALSDLNILRTYLNLMDMPPTVVVPCQDLNGDCVLTGADDFNFWTGSTTP